MIDVSCISCKFCSLRLSAALLGPCPRCVTIKCDCMQEYNVMFIINTTAIECGLVFNMINDRNSTCTKIFKNKKHLKHVLLKKYIKMCFTPMCGAGPPCVEQSPILFE